jgi:hypothetical protein
MEGLGRGADGLTPDRLKCINAAEPQMNTERHRTEEVANDAGIAQQVKHFSLRNLGSFDRRISFK